MNSEKDKKIHVELNDKQKMAAICGLFCGTCPQYPLICEGCLSEKIASDCESCPNGFRDCARKNKVTWCFECSHFPCQKLNEFKESHIKNGISHHKNIIEDLKRMKENGVENWIMEQEKQNYCEKCKSFIIWYEKISHKCNICLKVPKT